MNPMVSVIIPTYKRGDILARAIDSVLAQSYKNIEVIVVDDNDPASIERSNTECLVQRYLDDPKVKYIKHEQNKNGSAARNTGIRHAAGSYIAFLDDDDEFLSDKIEKQVEKMESLDVSWGACYTSYYKMNQNGFRQTGTERREGSLLVEALMRNLYIQAGSNLFVRSEVVKALNGFDESFKRNQDLEFLVRLLKKYKIAYVDSCSLIIHYEVRQVKRTYEDLMKIDAYYLEKFKSSIDELPEKDQKRIYSMIGLDGFRKALFCRKIPDALAELFRYNVSIWSLIKYLSYLIHRLVSKKSYGFEL